MDVAGALVDGAIDYRVHQLHHGRVGGDVDHNGYPDIAAFYKVGGINCLEVFKPSPMCF
jgi:hypothetical protein